MWSLVGQPPRLKAERELGAGWSRGLVVGGRVPYWFLIAAVKKSPPTLCLRATHLSPLQF